MQQERPAIMVWMKRAFIIDTSAALALAVVPIAPEQLWQSAAASTTDAQSLPPSSTQLWFTQHVQVAAWVSSDPDISTREIARRLYGGDGGGRDSVKAKEIREQVEVVLCSAVPAVPVVPNGENMVIMRLSEQGTGGTAYQ